ncbi:uncharacterized protein At4g06744-like [Bidens hawaiensis]|uniref:uncharacterized protein At4g06744-like n=1 Tax=Bidens hawaiensis TaxID=980011 RepID=UPI00404B96E3
MRNTRTFLLFICFTQFLTGNNGQQVIYREPQPKRSPLLPKFGGYESPRLKLVYPVIQAFKLKVKYDPLGITNTWKGKKICRDYKGFVCDTRPYINQLALADVKFNNYGFGGDQSAHGGDNLTLHDFLNKLPNIVFFSVNSNSFTGTIPSEISQASETLLEVLFSNNKLSGCLPYEIGLLKKATVFDVGFKELTGPIPHSFQCLKKMELLNLAHNTFSGTVPEEACSLPALLNFTVSYNYFTHIGPKCWKLIDNNVLDVKMNCILDLPNQRSAADCQKFFSKTHPSCVNDRSLTYVPCKEGLSGDQLESSDVQWTAPSPALEPGQAPRGWGSYGALSPH